MDTNLPPGPPPPPPPLPPPVYVPVAAAPRPPRRGGRGWMFVALLFMGLFLLSLAGSLFDFSGLMGSSAGGQSGAHFHEIVVEQNGSGNKIAIVDVEGMITSQAWDRTGRNMVDVIEDQLKVAAKDDSVKAVILKVDSPGGEVMASDDISRALLDFQEKHNKPVVAAMGGLAASGGYYVAAPCQWIVANELTITGSIGVILHALNYRGLMDKVGLYPRVFKSGRFKDMLSGTKPPNEVDPEEHKMIQSMIDETYGKFKKVVADGRKRAASKNQGKGKTLVDNWEEYADGRVLTGKQAFEHGFVDQLGNFDTAVTAAKRIANVSDANLIRYEEPFDLSSIFSILGKSEAPALKVDLGLELPKLQPGRAYFLAPTLVH